MSDLSPITKEVALRWVQSVSQPHFKVYIYGPVEKLGKLHRVLAQLREGKARTGSLSNLGDLGLAREFDSLAIWSSDEDGIKKLNSWLERHGYETSGTPWL